jgi:hypothetical protein
MRVHPFVPVALFAVAGLARGQGIEQRLQWARQTIDANAVTRHLEPPAHASETKWQVTKIDGCQVELKETIHRDTPDSVVSRGEVLDSAQDKIVTWNFDLAVLLPQYVLADTSVTVPQIKIFAEGDVFHLKTEFVSKTLRKDGSVADTRTWSAPGNTRNLWMNFDSPNVDNKAVVRRLESDLRGAVTECAGPSAGRGWWRR